MSLELISADSHVNPPPTMWREYLPAAFHERAPRLESTDEGDFEIFEGQRKPIMALNSLAGKKVEDYSLTVRRLTDTRAGGWDPASRLAASSTSSAASIRGTRYPSFWRFPR